MGLIGYDNWKCTPPRGYGYDEPDGYRECECCGAEFEAECDVSADEDGVYEHWDTHCPMCWECGCSTPEDDWHELGEIPCLEDFGSSLADYDRRVKKLKRERAERREAEEYEFEECAACDGTGTDNRLPMPDQTCVVCDGESMQTYVPPERPGVTDARKAPMYYASFSRSGLDDAATCPCQVCRANRVLASALFGWLSSNGKN